MMPRFKVPDTGRQVYVAAFLEQVRKSSLHGAVKEVAANVYPQVLREEAVKFAPPDGLSILQRSGVRDEEVFALPSMLEREPGLLGYYRLLLGISQKQFYQTSTGLNIFKPMEDRREITVTARPHVAELCSHLNESTTRLLHALPDGSLRINVDQLPLLTLGAQADGSWRTQLGSKATKGVFEAMKSIVRDAGGEFTETESSITVMNSSGREVTLMLAPDPDVVIREDFGASSEYKAAIEIKGGSDYSNVHNRAGEAEKSHRKAKEDGAGTCWTIIELDRVNLAKLRQESPSTREWIDLREVRNRSGEYWERLIQITRSAMGI